MYLIATSELKKRIFSAQALADALNAEILEIGYDLFEDQTEQQTLSKKVPDYYPVVLSAGCVG